MEKQAKELTQLIDEPINTIAKQVKDYEEEQKKKKKRKFLHTWQKCLQNYRKQLPLS